MGHRAREGVWTPGQRSERDETNVFHSLPLAILILPLRLNLSKTTAFEGRKGERQESLAFLFRFLARNLLRCFLVRGQDRALRVMGQ